MEEGHLVPLRGNMLTVTGNMISEFMLTYARISFLSNGADGRPATAYGFRPDEPFFHGYGSTRQSCSVTSSERSQQDNFYLLEISSAANQPISSRKCEPTLTFKGRFNSETPVKCLMMLYNNNYSLSKISSLCTLKYECYFMFKCL